MWEWELDVKERKDEAVSILFTTCPHCDQQLAHNSKRVLPILIRVVFFNLACDDVTDKTTIHSHSTRLLWVGWKFLTSRSKFWKEMDFPFQEGLFLMLSRSSGWPYCEHPSVNTRTNTHAHNSRRVSFHLDKCCVVACNDLTDELTIHLHLMRLLWVGRKILTSNSKFSERDGLPLSRGTPPHVAKEQRLTLVWTC